jgi:hypothetical protein
VGTEAKMPSMEFSWSFFLNSWISMDAGPDTMDAEVIRIRGHTFRPNLE